MFNFVPISPLDIIIILVVIFYAHEGYVLGFVIAFLDLVSFVVSFIVALKFYGVIAAFLANSFSLPLGFANAGGFFLTALITELVLSLLFRRGLHKLPNVSPSVTLYKIFKKIDHTLGLVPGAISAFIVLSFIFSVIVSLPSSPLIKNMVTKSIIGSRLIANASFFESKLNDVFGGALSETLNFLTVQPQSEERVKLNFKVTKGTVDSVAEQEMFRFVNTERARAGLHLLAFDNTLRDAARAHSKDMFERGYFSHYTPEGLSPFDRMDDFDIEYSFAGENLALAPSTDLAMQGLMNSPGHRRNILSPHFKKVGIGVIDGGIYGKMYSQEFTN
jgi:uncharacterized protein YkwD